ncbi:MATE family efflux transporter [candidate division WOR-3 bacterium]|nr:MATE family efflux transporter [candidate division WOR-3 bacterium]
MKNNTNIVINGFKKISEKPDLLNGALWKVLLQLSTPIIIANLFQTFYNLTDAFWLGKLGKSALAAPTITFNIVFTIIAIAGGLGAGGMTVLAQYKGAGNTEKVNETASNTFVLLIIISTTLAILGYILTPQILTLMQTPSDAYLLTLNYMRIIFIGIPFVFGFYIYQGLMQGYGDTFNPMKISALTVTLNIILDPVLIFGLGPFPRMGVSGAAIATIFSQFISSVIGISQMLSGKYGLKLSFSGFRFNREIVTAILKVGIPISISQTGTSFGFTVLMGIVNTFGSGVISAFGVGNRIISLLTTPAMGLAMGTSTVVAQNIGADRTDRAEHSVWVAALMNGVLLFILTTLLFFFGASVVRFFINDPEVIEIGKSMFKITSYSVLFFSIMMIFNASFRGSGHTMPTLIMQLSRLWLLRIPFAWLLAKTMGYGANGIFWAMFISNTVTAIVSFIWFKSGSWKRKILPIAKENIITEEIQALK